MDDKEKELLTTNVGVKGNVHHITIADFNLDHFDALMDVVEKMYDFWAYIIHDKDEGVEPHVHLLCSNRAGQNLKTHQEFFKDILPANFICKVKNQRAMAKYMIHKGYNHKFQYDPAEVFSNDKGKYISLLQVVSPSDNVFDDYRKVLQHQMKFKDFIVKYNYEFASMPFYQKLALYDRILKKV